MKKVVLVVSLILLGVMFTKTVYDIIQKERHMNLIEKNTEKSKELIELLNKNNELIEGLNID